jgi:HPt (histidine-containing phosphotransfer) domain-containing protein
LNRDEGFENLKTLFAADLAEKITALQAALRDANWDGVRSISHQITGTARSFGYPEISGIAGELEHSAGEMSLEHSMGLVKRISDLIVL